MSQPKRNEVRYSPRRNEEVQRGAWSTALIFAIMILLTLLMGLAVKGLLTGSIRPF